MRLISFFFCTIAICLGCIPLVSLKTYASSDPAFVAFAKNTKEIAIGYIHLKADRPLPLAKAEIEDLLAKIIKEKFAHKIGMKVLTNDQYNEILLDKTQPLRNDILQVNLMLSVFEGAELTPEISEKIIVMNLIFAKADSKAPFPTTKFLSTLVETKPALFLAEIEKREFKEQLSELLTDRLQKQMVRIICFEKTGPEAEACSKIALPPPTPKKGVSSAQ